ncbi:divalent-cation tolerance protein CutA [Helicobacter marmotae]|uniref:Divalent-cation tolerance protein CutA n=1 Tax=Helicobacter marmotae TaxID=152490 RepID=A0A3D8I5B3_9HELI|nr:divalent-cation tolerance protein CutA [Helicobacter marmotae]RDU60350.1 divalent-cation tolerance protein CutA [Helicobacter marmotae]
MLILLTTTSNKREAKALAQLLLESRLVACVQYYKIKSQYLWAKHKNKAPKIHKHKEWLLICKTLNAHYDEIQSLILSAHSYEVPEIITFEAKAQDAYEQWLYDTLT